MTEKDLIQIISDLSRQHTDECMKNPSPTDYLYTNNAMLKAINAYLELDNQSRRDGFSGVLQKITASQPNV